MPWRCLDAGSGAGTVAQWLAERVGPDGEVVAADIDATFLDAVASGSLHVLQHDILRGPVERGGFDLVHARFLLEWLREWQIGLDHLLASVKPGGVIVLSDIEWRSRLPAPEPIDSLLAAFPAVMQQHGGWNIDCGRELANSLEARGVRDVQAVLHAARVHGGSAGSDWPRLSIEPRRSALVATGRLDQAGLQAATAALTDGMVGFWLPPMVSAWGTVP